MTIYCFSEQYNADPSRMHMKPDPVHQRLCAITNVHTQSNNTSADIPTVFNEYLLSMKKL